MSYRGGLTSAEHFVHPSLFGIIRTGDSHCVSQLSVPLEPSVVTDVVLAWNIG